MARPTYLTQRHKEDIYYLNGHEGPTNSPQMAVNYEYNLDNLLWRYTTTTTGATGPTFAFGGATGPASNKAAVDGLGRLTSAFDTLTDTTGTPVTYTASYTYDRRSQLTYADIDKDAGNLFNVDYTYHKDGNLDEKEDNLTSTTTDCTYDGDLMTQYGATNITWDKNGRMTDGLNSVDITWNWDHRLREGEIDANNNIECQYSPDGAMAYKESTDAGTTTKHKFIVDRIGKIPVVLLVLDADDDDAIVKSYYHALGQTLAQRDGGWDADKYFYLQDRLGSVRQVVHYNSGTGSVDVDNRYTYDPFGNPISAETEDTNIDNPYRFANYVWDGTIDQYFCNKRWYDPVLARFTGRDPVFGSFREPLTLHEYLYCLNNPINKIDPSGKTANAIAGALIAGSAMHSAALYVASHGIDPGDEKWLYVGIDMEHLVAPSMYVGAFIGSLPLGKIAGAAGRGAALVARGAAFVGSQAYAGIYTAGYITAGIGWILINEISYLAISHPIAFINIVDFAINAVNGSPDPPSTPGGASGMLAHELLNIDEHMEEILK